MDFEEVSSAGPSFIRKRKGATHNTCAPSSKVKRLTRQLAGIMAHLQNHPGDVLSQQRVETIKQQLAGK